METETFDVKVTPFGAIRFILATPDYNDGEAGLNEDYMNEISTWLAKAQAEYDAAIARAEAAAAECEALRAELAAVIVDYQDRLAGAFMDIGAVVMERDALRDAATKFANTMAALSPRWTSEMAKAWTELFAVIDK